MERDAYDVPEMQVLARMTQIMIREDGLARADFEGLTFTEIESMFLDEYEHEDFRPAEN